MRWQSSCIIPSCKSRPTSMCGGCTPDVADIVFVCEPSNNKRCWGNSSSSAVAESSRCLGESYREAATQTKKKTEQQLWCSETFKAKAKFTFFESSSQPAQLICLEKYLHMLFYDQKILLWNPVLLKIKTRAVSNICDHQRLFSVAFHAQSLKIYKIPF